MIGVSSWYGPCFDQIPVYPLFLRSPYSQRDIYDELTTFQGESRNLIVPIESRW